MTGSSDLRSFLLMSEAKLVFVNVTGSNRTLCYVDFSSMFPYVMEYLDDRSVYDPTISPDGRYVAYCSRNEGQTGAGRISIRSLDSLHTRIVQLSADSGYLPRWWINPGNGDTDIVYTNSGIDDNNPMWSGTRTYVQKMSGGMPAAGVVPVEIVNDGSYHDGLSVNGRYAVTGFTRLKRRDMVSGSDSQLFVSPQNGKATDDGSSLQVCNVSMSPDRGDSVRCMFLDFGYSGRSTVTGGSYGVHEYLFVGDMAGRILEYMRCPSGEQSWDGVEWSNQVRFGVGCGRNGAGQAHAVYAIDLEKTNSKPLVTGTEIQQPYLLADHSISNELDSLGRYNDPSIGGDPQTVLATKLLMFWRFVDSLEIAVIGSSQALFGFDPGIFAREGLTALNMASPVGDLHMQSDIILNYLLKHCPDLKIICSSVDVGWLNVPNGDHSWSKGVGQSNGYKFDSCHDFWSAGVPRYFYEIINQVPFAYPLNISDLGFLAEVPQGWGDSLPPNMGGNTLTWDTSDVNYRHNLATIGMLADTLRLRRIHWIMINFPSSPNYKNTSAYTPFGPSRPTGHAIISDIKKLDAANDYFDVYDANNDGDHDYGDTDAADFNHLSVYGAAKLTGRIKVKIDSILNR
jgi:hypothetical protein